MKVTIYGRPGCKDCETAKVLCYRAGITYEYKVVGVDVTQDLFARITGGARSIPQIFVTGEGDGMSQHIGGLDKLQQFIKDGTH